MSPGSIFQADFKDIGPYFEFCLLKIPFYFLTSQKCCFFNMQSWTFSVCEHLITGLSLQEERRLLGFSTIKTSARGWSKLLKTKLNEHQRETMKKKINETNRKESCVTELYEGELCDPEQSTAIHCQKFEPALEAFTWPAKAENLTLAKVTTPKIFVRLFGAAHKNTWEDQSFSLGLEGIKSHRKYLQGRKKKITKSQRLLISFPAKMYHLNEK